MGNVVRLDERPRRERFPSAFGLAPPLEACAVIAAGAAIVLTALVTTPTAYGDSAEYFLMTESLANHLTPDARPEDLNSLAEMARRNTLRGGYGRVMAPYLMTDDARWYSIHFWAYPLACLPAKVLLRVTCLNEMKVPQVTNALLLAAALGVVAFRSRFRAVPRRLFWALLALSPALGFVLWPHPEVFSFCFVAMALTFMHEDRRAPALLCASVASLQNPPLLLFVAYLWLRWAVRFRWRWDRGPSLTVSGQWPEVAVLTALAALAAAPAAFYLVHLGTASPLARDAAGAQFLSPSKALELFFDLNLGMLPYAPAAVLGALALGGALLVRRRARASSVALAAVVALMALACTATTNWNHGTTGPSRYAVWLLPFVLYLFAAAGGSNAVNPGDYRAAAVLAVAVQVVIAVARGGMFTPLDYLEHSYAARFVLDRWPAAYNPTPDIFISRTVGHDSWGRGPFVYQSGGRCRKAFAKPKHAEALRAACGSLPEGDLPFFDSRDEDDKRWAYVDY